MKKYKIDILNKKKIKKMNFNSKKCNSLLNFFKINKINIRYQCQEGFCGVCKVNLINGKISYFIKPIAIFKKNEILPCVCFPISNIKIYIN